MQGIISNSVNIWRLLPLWMRALIRATRPRQWVKNGLIFIPVLFDRQISLSNPTPTLRVIAAFVLFTMAASAIYLINDLVDVERDRMHPKKRFRPIASGELPARVASGVAVILPVLAIGGALSFSPPLALILVIYFIKQIGYSFWLKHVVLMDVMLLAAGYILRVVAGVVVISVSNFSPWLYVCIGSGALFLAVVKRRQEMIKLGDKASEIRATFKEYTMPLLDDMLRIVTTGALMSYTLYAAESRTALAGPRMLLTVPFVVYGLFRYLYLMHVKGEGGAPDELLFKDRPLLISVVLFFLVTAALIYIR